MTSHRAIAVDSSFTWLVVAQLAHSLKSQPMRARQHLAAWTARSLREAARRAAMERSHPLFAVSLRAWDHRSLRMNDDPAAPTRHPTKNATVCPICGAASALYFSRDSFDIARCERCAFMFAILPDGFDPAALYDDDYFHSITGCGITDYDELWRKCSGRFYVPRLARLREFTRGNRLLDIGCAGGQLLCAARDRGFQVTGIERASGMRLKAAEAAACRVYESVQEALAAGDKFDCITMFEVIEHLPNPIETLKEIAGLLGPAGVLAVSTPNCERPGAREGRPINIWFCPPLHISYFTAETLRRSLAEAGFKTLAIDGLEHYCRAMAGEIVLPDWLIKVLTPIRRGKRLRPHGLLGRLLKRLYKNRIALYRRRAPADILRTDVLEVYAVKQA